MKQQILQILEDYFADEAMTAEIMEVLDKHKADVIVGIETALSMNDSLPVAVSLLDNKLLSQREIMDWATLHGYAMIKCTSVADRLKVEKVAREIWGSEGQGDTYFLE